MYVYVCIYTLTHTSPLRLCRSCRRRLVFCLSPEKYVLESWKMCHVESSRVTYYHLGNMGGLCRDGLPRSRELAVSTIMSLCFADVVILKAS